MKNATIENHNFETAALYEDVHVATFAEYGTSEAIQKFNNQGDIRKVDILEIIRFAKSAHESLTLKEAPEQYCYWVLNNGQSLYETIKYTKYEDGVAKVMWRKEPIRVNSADLRSTMCWELSLTKRIYCAIYGLKGITFEGNQLGRVVKYLAPQMKTGNAKYGLRAPQVSLATGEMYEDLGWFSYDGETYNEYTKLANMDVVVQQFWNRSVLTPLVNMRSFDEAREYWSKKRRAEQQ